MTEIASVAAVDCPWCDAARSADPVARRRDADGRRWICYVCSVCARTHEGSARDA